MRSAAAAKVAERGYRVVYHDDQVNHCPGCGRSQWFIGRSSAECAFCNTAIPLRTTNGGNDEPRRI